jgi:Flp pilus assembly protein TadB
MEKNTSPEPDQPQHKWSGLEVSLGQVTCVVFVVFNVVAVLAGMAGFSLGQSFFLGVVTVALVVAILAWPTDPLP